MRNKFVVGALACALMLTGAIAAWAVPSSQSTLNVTFKPGSKQAGTKKKPKANTLNVTIKGGTTTGQGQPATSTSLNTTLPKTWKLNSEKWPKKKRCSIVKVNQDKSTASCPKGSKVGAGLSTALAGDGAITQKLVVTAFVIKNGDIGFFLKGSVPVAVAQMIQGVTSTRKLSVKIPPNLQQPLMGVKTGIVLLQVKFKGSAKYAGKTHGILETTGCKGKSWSFTEEDVYDDGGRNKDTDTARCRK